MILQHLATSLRKQDWFTVAIETLIVVLGVFLGLQANNWNAARLDAQDTKSVLAGLQGDFESQLSYAERQAERSGEAIAASSRLIQGIRAGKLDEKSIVKDSVNCINIPGLPGPSSTFQELGSSGRMDLIRDEELRSELYAYDSNVTQLRSAFPRLIEPFYDLQKEMMKVQSLTATGEPTPEFAQLGRIDSVNSAAMLEDRPLYDALQVSYVSQDYLHLTLVNTATSIEHILELLKQAQEQKK